MRELVRIATSEGALVLSSKCTAGEAIPFAAFADALNAYLVPALQKNDGENARTLERVRQAAGDFSSSLRTLCRGLAVAIPATGHRPADAAAERERFAERWVCAVWHAARSTGVGLIVLDDIQWMDAGSRELLAELAAQLTSFPFLSPPRLR